VTIEPGRGGGCWLSYKFHVAIPDPWSLLNDYFLRLAFRACQAQPFQLLPSVFADCEVESDRPSLAGLRNVTGTISTGLYIVAGLEGAAAVLILLFMPRRLGSVAARAT